MKPSYLLLLPILFLTACAATGQPYHASNAPAGKSQVIIYRTNDIKLGGAPVSVNGRKACNLPSGGYYAITAEPNKLLSLTIQGGLDPRTSHFDITPKSGQTYYVSVEINPSGVIGSGLFGLAGNAMAQREADMVFRDGNVADATKTREACK